MNAYHPIRKIQVLALIFESDPLETVQEWLSSVPNGLRKNMVLWHWLVHQSRSVLELIPISKSQMSASCLPAGYPQKIITYDEAQIPNVNFLVPACLKNNLRCPEFFRLNPLSQMFVNPAR